MLGEASMLTLALEVALLALLAACLFYCWRLDRRLSRLREGEAGMREAIGELVQAVAQADAAIRGLRGAAAESGRDLQARIDEAKMLAERLGVGLGRVRTSADLPRAGGVGLGKAR